MGRLNPRFRFRTSRVRTSAEQRQRHRVAVDEVPAADRANLTIAEEAGAGVSPEQFIESLGVVMALTKQVAPPSGAGKDERCERAHAARSHINEHMPEVGVGARPVPKLKLKGLTNPGQ